MSMRPFPVYPDPGVTHDGDGLAAFDRIARVHPDGTQMPVQTVVAGAVPAVLDHDVFSVVRVAGHKISMHDFPIGNGAHFVGRAAPFLVTRGTHYDSFFLV